MGRLAPGHLAQTRLRNDSAICAESAERGVAAARMAHARSTRLERAGGREIVSPHSDRCDPTCQRVMPGGSMNRLVGIWRMAALACAALLLSAVLCSTASAQ